ncbi:TPA: DUF1983 domain-containing protein [Enterobacter chengduensis]|nr:DUF1983 domain-containing protein [Enterobacter chengduensis]
MTGLEIIETDEGYELHSPAGEAKYDAWGARREVNGIPEYFPSSISIKNRKPAETGDNKNYKSGFEIAIDTGDAAKAIDEIDEHICNSDAFKKLTNGWSFEKDGTLIINNGQVFINDAKISDGVLSTSYNVKLHVAYKGKSHEAGMSIGVEDGQRKVVFEADRFKVNEAAQSSIENAVVSVTKSKIKLGDEMTQAIIDAVRESDLFTAMQVNIDAQTASLTGLQQAMHDAVNDAIRNALKPGGLLYNR